MWPTFDANVSIWARCCLTLVLAVAPGARALGADGATPGGTRLAFGGEASVSIAPADRGFFNRTAGGRYALRVARLALSASVRAGERFALLGEVRSEDFDPPRVFALYARVRPWTGRSFDVQAGLIPPVFGAFARRLYGPENALVGFPLGYQYLTSLRPDAAPATADDLLRMRGRGSQVSYPIGSPASAGGLPLVNALRWDTGVQLRLGSEPLELSAALTQGSLSNPSVRDDNGGKQVSARVACRPVVGLVVGVSGARGDYTGRELRRALADTDTRSLIQHAWGADIEYSRAHWLLRAEAIWSAWDVPAGRAPLIEGPVRAVALVAEGRYKLLPGLYVAARADHLGFSRIVGSAGSSMWDAKVSRLEAGLGFSLRRNLLLKAVYQQNWRDGGPVRTLGLGAAQLQFWF